MSHEVGFSHFEAKYKKPAEETAARVGVTWSDFEANPLEGTIRVYAACNLWSRESPLKPDRSLYHIEQVATVAAAMVDLLPNSQKDTEINRAILFSRTHDIGRPMDMANHPGVGYYFLKAIGTPNGNGSYPEFANRHDKFGLGFNSFYEKYNRGILREIQETHRNVETSTEIINSLEPKDLRWHTEELVKEYGIAGLSTLIADLSKEYPHGNCNGSVIAPFSLAKGEGLIRLQVEEVKKFPIYSEDHLLERIGARFIADCIDYYNDYMKKSYNEAGITTFRGQDVSGVNWYEIAIQDATHKWPHQKESLEKKWESHIETVLA